MLISVLVLVMQETEFLEQNNKTKSRIFYPAPNARYQTLVTRASRNSDSYFFINHFSYSINCYTLKYSFIYPSNYSSNPSSFRHDKFVHNLISIIGKFKFIQDRKCQSHNHTYYTSKYHTC